MANQIRIAELIAEYSAWTDDRLTRELPSWDHESNEYAAILSLLEERKREREAQAESLTAKRHDESTALSREGIAASHYANLLAKVAIGIAAVALIVAVVSLWKAW